MADITERDKNNLWAEMPPSGKKRLQQENSQPKPAPERAKRKNQNPRIKRQQKSRRIKRVVQLKKRQKDRQKT